MPPSSNKQPEAMHASAQVSEVYIWEGSEKGLYYRRGYPLGTPGNKSATTLVNNHLAFTVKIHKPDGLPGWRIVGFEVVPYSVESSRIDSECTADGDFDADKYPPQTLVVTPPSEATKSLSWSYSLHWVEVCLLLCFAAFSLQPLSSVPVWHSHVSVCVHARVWHASTQLHSVPLRQTERRVGLLCGSGGVCFSCFLCFCSCFCGPRRACVCVCVRGCT